MKPKRTRKQINKLIESVRKAHSPDETTLEDRLMIHWKICELLNKVDLDARKKIIGFLASVYCDEITSRKV